MSMDARREPPRGSFPPETEREINLIHLHVWGEPYKLGRGPMHHAGGSYWHNELLRLADSWERMAQAARICAEYLPDEVAA